MKKVLSLLMMLTLAVGAWAETATFLYTGNGQAEKTVDGITITISKGNSSTDPATNTYSGEHFRIYKDNIITIDAGTNIIESVVFTCTSSSYASNWSGDEATAGTISVSGSEVTLSSVNATTTIITHSGAATRITQAVVTYISGETPAVAIPVINGETPFTESTEVTITCGTAGASIYYTIDGTEPTNQSTAYNAPFELTESATVKAIAYDANNNASLVASKQFVKKASCATVTEILALGNNTEFTFTGSLTTIDQAVSANGSSKYLYAQDEAGVGMLLFNAPVDYSKGDVIPAGWAGKITTYKGAPEVTSISGMQAATETAELTAAEMTPAEVTVDPYNLFHYAVIKGVSIVDDNIVVGEESVAVYCDRFGIAFPQDYEGKTFDVYGIPSWYNVAQFMPLEIVEVQQVVESTITYEAEQEGGTIAVALADGTQVVSAVTKVAAGEQVTITATPAEGYKLSNIVVKCGDEVVEFDTEITPGRAAETRTFTMPEGDVSIEATFEKETPTGIENLSMENVKSVRFYNAAGVESATPFNGVNIVVREMTDGSKSVIKVVK